MLAVHGLLYEIRKIVFKVKICISSELNYSVDSEIEKLMVIELGA